MAATFPLAIRTFTQKRNLLDDVEASHINDIQDEIDAIEQTLGLNPHQDPTLVNSVTKWGTVADRLNYMTRRSDLPVITLYRSAALTSKTDVLVTPTYPGPSTDTHGLFNGGSGFKVQRRGVYHVHAHMSFLASALKGTRELKIMRNGSNASITAVPHTGASSAASNIWLQACWTGVLNVGDVVTTQYIVEAANFGLPTGNVTGQFFGLDAFMVRDI